MSVSGTIWNIQDSTTGNFTAYFSGASAVSGTWGDLNDPVHHGPWRQSDEVLLFKGPLFIWAARVDGTSLHGVVTNFSGTGGSFNGGQDPAAQAKRAKARK